MYTRSSRQNYSRQDSVKRYTPPPGYVGTAFSENPEVKHHVPEQDVQEFTARRTRDEEMIEEESKKSLIEEETLPAEQHEHESKPHDESPLHGLIESLHGKIGTEELIILMTMFLISSDGICVEALVLALVLLAGHEPK